MAIEDAPKNLLVQGNLLSSTAISKRKQTEVKKDEDDEGRRYEANNGEPQADKLDLAKHALGVEDMI